VKLAAAGVIGAFFALAAPAVAQTPGYGAPEQSGQEAQPISGAEALSPFFRALSAVQSGQRQAPVRIVQIGDSLTANDFITTSLRAQLQARFGAGGRGPMTVGAPYRGYHPDQVETDQTGGWRMEASFSGKGSGGPEFVSPGPFGLSGWRLSTDQPGQTATLDAHLGAFFDRATLCGLAQPGGGSVEMTAGDRRERIDFAAAEPQVICRTVRYPTLRSHLEVTTEGGPVSLLSWSTEREAPGIALANMGVVGTQLSDFAGRDDQALRAEFDAYEPDLIVLAYGVNEGYRPAVDGEAYESLLRHEIERLKRLVPAAAILVLGTPDANTVRPDIYGTGRAAAFVCAPLSADEAADYEQLVATRSPRLLRWFPPAGLATVRQAQRRAATEEGVAYWDWQARMGGACSAHALAHADPPLVRGDHIHFTPEGGRWLGGLLAADLLAAYAGGGR
jgi:lysophospholipase L1-like esterase